MLRKSKDNNKHLVEDHVVALNNQCKLESTNAVLHHDNKILSEKVLKLSEALKVSNKMLLEKEECIEKLQDTLKVVSEKQRSENEVFDNKILKSKIVEKKLKSELEIMKVDMQSMQKQLLKIVEDLKFYKSKSKEYKLKLKNSMELLCSLNQMIENRTTFSEKECQTSKEFNVCELDQSRYDEQILSELFFKENPFTDTLLL